MIWRLNLAKNIPSLSTHLKSSRPWPGELCTRTWEAVSTSPRSGVSAAGCAPGHETVVMSPPPAPVVLTMVSTPASAPLVTMVEVSEEIVTVSIEVIMLDHVVTSVLEYLSNNASFQLI